METFEFMKTMLWIMFQPIIAWAVMDVINVPAYIKMVKQFKQRQEQEEMMEISLIVADAFHREKISIGK